MKKKLLTILGLLLFTTGCFKYDGNDVVGDLEKKYNIHMQINKSIKYYTVCCHKKPHKLNQFLSITFMLHRRI